MRMFALIWATLLFSVRGSDANTGAPVENCQTKDFCITLREGEITAEAGLCVVIPCSFRTASSFTAQNIVWFKCENSNMCEVSEAIFNTTKPNKVLSGFKGRVSLLEPDVSQKNCSIIINDLTVSDSGSYQFRVEEFKSDGKTSGFTFIQKAKVSVKDLTQKPTVTIPPLTEGQRTTLSCTAPGLCSGSAPEITWTFRGPGENITNVKTDTLTAVAKRDSLTLTFTPSAKHHGTKFTCKVSFLNTITTEETVTLNVTYVRKPVITGKTIVKEGDALNLNCSVDSFPPSVITWTKLGSNKTLESNTGTATLLVRNMTAENSGKYICTATRPKYTTHAEVKLGLPLRILNSSACKVQSEVLTCVCISEGLPLPTIEWLLLKNHTEYSVTNSVSKNTVNTSITVPVKDRNYTTVVCVSRNDFGDVKNLIITIAHESKQEDPFKKMSISIELPQVIIAFLIGTLLSATVCCLTRTCHRKKHQRSGNTVIESLDMMDAGKALEKAEPHDQEGAEGGAEATGESAPNGDVEYSDIHFDLLKRNNPREDIRETTETEYSEIKKNKTEDSQDNDGKDGGMLEGMVEEERKGCVPDQEEGEDMALYSNLKDLMGKI
uniref:sialic acid-binding Ig-like lectin 5 isoform X2 n=1 Tax=Semicossyphus pulcher TaxID=241346 RepID=UPI0037E91A1E